MSVLNPPWWSYRPWRGLRARRQRAPRVAPAAVEPTEFSLLSDTPLEDRSADYFGFGAFADSLAILIVDSETSTPLTLAISAPWGGGKTSVAKLVEHRIVELTDEELGERPSVICWFNAWSHADAPHLGAALAASVARAANERRQWWRRVLEPLPTTVLSPRERWRRRAGLVAASLIIVGLCLMITPVREAFSSLEVVQRSPLASLGSVGALVAVSFVVWPKIFSAAEAAARFIDDPRAEASSGAMATVRDQLGRLVRQGTRGARLVIFVDDLERCQSARAVEVCEVASQLLNQEGVVTVLVADMAAIATAAEERYAVTSAAQGRDPSSDLGRRYLEKIVQIQLALPPPRRADIVRLLRGESPIY